MKQITQMITACIDCPRLVCRDTLNPYCVMLPREKVGDVDVIQDFCPLDDWEEG